MKILLFVGRVAGWLLALPLLLLVALSAILLVGPGSGLALIGSLALVFATIIFLVARMPRKIPTIVGGLLSLLVLIFGLSFLLVPHLLEKGMLRVSRNISDLIYLTDQKTHLLSEYAHAKPIDPALLRNVQFVESSSITDVDGVELGCFAKEYRMVIPVDDALKNSPIVKAILASEDQWFWEHKGIDTYAIFRATVSNQLGGRIKSGGSTLTMQVVKNMYLSPERTFARKIKEAIYAAQLEHTLSKDEILHLYVNLVYFGGSYGIEAASHSYFGVSAKSLSPAQAAFLAGLINQPNVFNLRGEKGRVVAMAKKERVLHLMYEHHFLTDKEYSAAVAEKIAPEQFKGACKNEVPYIRAEVNREFGVKQNLPIAAIGAKVQTTIKLSYQRALEAACTASLSEYLKRHPENKETVQCSSIAVDHRTGEIVAMVSGQDFAKNQYNGVTQSARQAGSSFKPFLYAAYLEKLYGEEDARRQALCVNSFPEACQALRESPMDLVNQCFVVDKPISVPAVVGSKGQVVTRHDIHNYPYDNPKKHPPYLGKTTCRRAIAESRNAATVWAEGQLAPESLMESARWTEGEKRIIALAHRLGIESELEAHAVLPLGSEEVTLWEMARAFIPFVNGGCKKELTFIHKAVDARGQVLYDSKGKTACERVLAPQVALGMRTLLEGVVNDDVGTAHSLRNQDMFPKGLLLGKTGTATNSDEASTDAWFIGMTAKYLIATRINNTKKTPLGKKETGGRNALPVFAKFIKDLNLMDPVEPFLPPPLDEPPLPQVPESAPQDESPVPTEVPDVAPDDTEEGAALPPKVSPEDAKKEDPITEEKKVSPE